MKCPICKGKGELLKPKHTIPDNVVMAKLLHKEGYSHRQIMRFLKLKTASTISYYLRQNEA